MTSLWDSGEHSVPHPYVTERTNQSDSERPLSIYLCVAAKLQRGSKLDFLSSSSGTLPVQVLAISSGRVLPDFLKTPSGRVIRRFLCTTHSNHIVFIVVQSQATVSFLKLVF